MPLNQPSLGCCLCNVTTPLASMLCTKCNNNMIYCYCASEAKPICMKCDHIATVIADIKATNPTHCPFTTELCKDCECIYHRTINPKKDSTIIANSQAAFEAGKEQNII